MPALYPTFKIDPLAIVKKSPTLSLSDYPGLDCEPIVVFSSISIYPLTNHEFKYAAYYEINGEHHKFCFNSLDVGAQGIAAKKNPKDISQFIKSMCK